MTPGLKQTASQEERGVAYRFYVENALADPSLVGAHWFEWIDEPSTGVFYGGLVAAPVFASIMGQTLRLMEAPYDAPLPNQPTPAVSDTVVAIVREGN